MKENQKKVVFSGIQPSGSITLGNYLGALKHWVAMQDDYDCIYCVVNQHAITVRKDATELRHNTMQAFALLMACGIDPEKSTLFVQSHVPEHAQLMWVLNCYTPFGELNRMTQFKEKSAQHPENVNAGLFTYPTLMAADIMLYQTDLVPVGDDQRQHLELTRDIVQRFNGIHGDVFQMPDGYIPEFGARIMSLQDPLAKMSKSDDNPRATINILDEPEAIRRKFRSAVTDSGSEVVYREGKDGINNLMTIYATITEKTLDQVEEEFAGKGYGDFKAAVGDAVVDYLAPIRERYHELMDDRKALEALYEKGAKKAQQKALRTLRRVYRRVGLS